MLVDSSMVPMAYGPLNGLTVTYVNDAMCGFFETSRESLLTGDVSFGLHPDDVEESERLSLQLARGEIDQFTVLRRYVWPDGRVKWAQSLVARVPGDPDSEPMAVAQTIDMTMMMEGQQALARLANVDPVMGIGTRAWITAEIDRAVGEAGATGCRPGVMLIDLSEFQIVDHTHGFQAGDEVRATLARRIESVLPPDYSLGRFDGFRVVVLAPDVRDPATLREQAEDVLAEVERELFIRLHRISRTASIGIAVVESGDTGLRLLRDADAACAVAKASGRSHVHVRGLPESSPKRDPLRLEHDLRIALERGEFTYLFQPQVRLDTGDTVGAESLLRWQHPLRGVLAPGEVIDVLEESGLIVDVGRAMLDRLCADIRAQRAPDVPISVNVSAVELTTRGWFAGFADTLGRHGVDPRRLVVEVTESSVLRVSADVETALAGLRDLGVGIHLDDFGTGYTSVAALRALPLTAVKLDRSFLAPLASGETEAEALVRGIALLARGLGLTTIAEGIETAEQAQRARDCGWAVGQGYLFGRPGPWVAAHSRRPPVNGGGRALEAHVDERDRHDVVGEAPGGRIEQRQNGNSETHGVAEVHGG